MAWPMGTHRNFRRVGDKPKKPPHVKKRPPHRKNASNKVKKVAKKAST